MEKKEKQHKYDNRKKSRGIWVAESVKGPNLDLGQGYDLRVMR